MVNWSISTANLERPSNSMAKAANVVEVPSVVKLTGMKALTIAAWVKPNEIIRCHRNIDNLPETNWGVYRLLKRPIHEIRRGRRGSCAFARSSPSAGLWMPTVCSTNYPPWHTETQSGESFLSAVIWASLAATAHGTDYWCWWVIRQPPSTTLTPLSVNLKLICDSWTPMPWRLVESQLLAS